MSKAIGAPTTNGAGAASVPASRRKPGKASVPAPLFSTEPTTLMQAICAAATNPEMDTAKVEHLIRLRKRDGGAEAERAFNDALAKLHRPRCSPLWPMP